MLVGIDVILGLLVAVAALALLARKISVPYPILLVIGGLLLALTPGVPQIKLDPHIIFILFLPPLLYPAALFTSWRDFRANLRPITMLAVGLVVFTTCLVGWFAHSTVAELPLAAAFILGAIVSPPDAVAATAVMERLNVPRRIVTIIEGESLVNDATALVAYGLAIDALNGGSFLAWARGRSICICVRGGSCLRPVDWLDCLPCAATARRPACANHHLPAHSIRCVFAGLATGRVRRAGRRHRGLVSLAGARR